PKLPTPFLQDTCKRYLTALQDGNEHALTTRAVQSFLQGDGPALQERLKQQAAGRARRVSTQISRNSANVLRSRLCPSCHPVSLSLGASDYLLHRDPVVLALNPFLCSNASPIPWDHLLILMSLVKE
ncbi:hypothetical protein OG21DRAFT_1424835, partial [Imleria badia]